MCTKGIFDTTTGDYVFSSIQVSTYPPGVYTFTITGTLNNLSDATTLTVTFVDPCPNAVLTINKPADFIDTDYILRDPPFTIHWDSRIIAIASTDPLKCGSFDVRHFANGQLLIAQ